MQQYNIIISHQKITKSLGYLKKKNHSPKAQQLLTKILDQTAVSHKGEYEGGFGVEERKSSYVGLLSRAQKYLYQLSVEDASVGVLNTVKQSLSLVIQRESFWQKYQVRQYLDHEYAYLKRLKLFVNEIFTPIVKTFGEDNIVLKKALADSIEILKLTTVVVQSLEKAVRNRDSFASIMLALASSCSIYSPYCCQVRNVLEVIDGLKKKR
eukprot:TRINITY_DN11930_c0_g1_i1.p1 TRINITY_DN11930_c0_g1~~TRINITY_DN11930_c0_g1_i1.p1  ORF type:complete len:210 (-),score=30.09 TRINITY_DN11930_c0_g1_i1:570-1199(-)